MKSRFFLAAAVLLGAFAAPGVAAAQSIAYTVGFSNMRAGPGTDYPVVAQIQGGSVVNVYGCLSDYSWCDTSVQSIRGWMSTTRLQFQYGGSYVPFTPTYYGYFGAPIIRFDFGGYWDRYYFNRPFYANRHHYRDYQRPRDNGAFWQRPRNDRPRDNNVQRQRQGNGQPTNPQRRRQGQGGGGPCYSTTGVCP